MTAVGTVLRRARVRVPLSVIVVSVPVLVFLAVLIQAVGEPFTPGGDVAIIELDVRHLFSDWSLLGPYSRFGWRHPGPAMPMLLSPVYWLSGESSRSLFLASWAINSACFIGVVVLVRQAAGEWTARVAAMLCVAAIICLGSNGLINPWNPSLVAVPTLLLLVATARAATGSTAALVVAFAAGTFATQTHVSLAPLTAVCMLIGLAGVVLARRAQDPAERRPLRAPLIVAGAIAVVFWGPPLAEQAVGGRHGNMAAIIESYRNPPEREQPHGYPLDEAAGFITKHATTFPLSAPGEDPEPRRGRLVVVGCVAAWFVFALAWRRARFLSWLALMTPLAVGISIFGASRLVGPALPYLFNSSQLLLVPIALATAGTFVVFIERAGKPAVVRAIGFVAMFIAVARGFGFADSAGTTSFGDSPDARVAAAAIAERLGHDRSRVIRVTTVGYGYNAATLVELDKAGFKYRLTHEYSMYDGNTEEPVDGPTFLVLEVPPDSSERLDEHVVKTGGLDVWIEDFSAGESA